MKDHAGERAGIGIQVPHGWLDVDPDGTVGFGDAPLRQLVTLADWDDADGTRPTMSVALAEPTEAHVAARVLAQAEESLRDLHVVSIDPWAVPGSSRTGRRLTLVHLDGAATVTTLVWVVATTAGDVIVSAHVESMHLHLHEHSFAQALAGLVLPEVPLAATVPLQRGDADGVAGASATADLIGEAPPAAWDPAGAEPPTVVADPESRILVEASVAGTTLTFDATLARDHATITATQPPRTLDDSGPGSSHEAGATTFQVPVTRLALAIARWLGLRPAVTAASEAAQIPLNRLMTRLIDPSVTPPDGADMQAWQQPWFLWTLRSSATEAGLVMVDTGTSGQCAVMETEDEHTTRFAPLSSYNVWLTLNWLVAESVAQ